MRPDYELRPHGDAAILVTFGDSIDPLVNRRVHVAAAAIRATRGDGMPWATPIPSYASLLIGYDARAVDYEDARAALDALLAASPEPLDEPEPQAIIEIPVRYGGDDGPDLDAVAERTGLTAAQVVALHSSVVYRAYLLGFAPGFAYLGELPAQLELPRRDTPRQRVPPGSVAIAGRQTAVYPLSTPGGWHLVGRTDLVVWDVQRSPPALIAAGDAVRFVPRA
jgi:KipI family sensor histidine kinase inhibitor